jgi:hypothetical protein
MSKIIYSLLFAFISILANSQNVVFTKDAKQYDVVYNSIEADGIYAYFANDAQKLNRRFEVAMVDSFYCNNSAMVDAAFKSNASYRSLFKTPIVNKPVYYNYTSNYNNNTPPVPSVNQPPAYSGNPNAPSTYNLNANNNQSNLNNNQKSFLNYEAARLLTKGGEQIAIGAIVPVIGTLLFVAGVSGLTSNSGSSTNAAGGVLLGILAYGSSQIIGTAFIISGGFNIRKSGVLFTQAQAIK